MNRVLLTLLSFFGLLMSCGETQKAKKDNPEELFYHKLDSLKELYSGKEITITKRKFIEDADPGTSIYLYTNADKDNLGDKVMFSDGVKYKLDYGQIASAEYEHNSLDKNLMILVELDKEGMTNQRGWISLENVREFQAIEPFLNQLK